MHALSFFAELLVHTKGDFARKPFVPAAWEQDEVIVPLMGTVVWDESRRRYVRRYRELYLSTGRKNGKTELIAGLMLYVLVGVGEDGGELYGLALDKDQAALAWRVAARMVELSQPLRERLDVARAAQRIVDPRSSSFFTVIAGDALGALGSNPSAAYIDELLAQPNREMYDALRTGFGTRAEPLLILATTADSDPGGFAAAEREWSERVTADPSLDPARLVVLHAVPRDADWSDEANWHLANPGLGDYLDIRVLRDEYAKAVKNPAEERAFRQFRLNQQSKQAGRAIDMTAWEQGAVPPPEPLAGRACWAGLDLASTSDLASYALDFPDGNGGHDAVWRVFCPESAVSSLDRRTGGKASAWAAAGVLTVTEGNVIDYTAIKVALRKDAETYDVREVAFDRWGATQLSTELIEEGFPLIQFGQGFASMAAPTRELLRLIAGGLYRHGGNPAVTWQAGNLIVRTDPAGNMKPDKERSGEKIDSMVCAVMALDRALRGASAPPEEDYIAAGW